MKGFITVVSLLIVSVAGADVYNPCGIVVGEPAWFKMQLKPDDFPNNRIAWSASGSGSVDFPLGNRGREFCVRGTSPGSVTLSVQIGDSPHPRPCFFAKVITNSVVKVYAWILSDANGAATTQSAVEEMFAGVNEIWKQAGITFQIEENIVTNMPGYLDIFLDSNDGPTHAQLVNHRHGLDGLEIYFVRSLPGISTAQNSSGGTIAGTNAVVSTLAHELGHACGLRDIYTSRNGQVLTDEITKARMPRDWNSEGEAGHYPTDLTMRMLLPRLLMYGYKDANKCDISIGDVFGVWYTNIYNSATGEYERSWRTSLAPIGFFDHGTNMPRHQ